MTVFVPFVSESEALNWTPDTKTVEIGNNIMQVYMVNYLPKLRIACVSH